MSNRIRVKATFKQMQIKSNESTITLVLDKWEIDKVPDLAEFAGCEVYVDMEAAQQMIDFEEGE